MQAVVDALRMSPTIKALICNVEMPPKVLLDRQLARLSGVPLSIIRHRQLTTDNTKRINEGHDTISSFADRLGFLLSPFSLENVAAAADTLQPQIIVLDYIQRLRATTEHTDKRSAIDHSMECIRGFANRGQAVIVVSAVTRTKDKQGRSSYDGDNLNLASFRESSELEFGADDAFILVDNPLDDTQVKLKHLKARYSAAKDLPLCFDRGLQKFTPLKTDEVSERWTPRKVNSGTPNYSEYEKGFSTNPSKGNPHV